MTRQINDTGLRLIENYEGLSLRAYHGAADRPGLLTIGYGHTAAAGPPIVTAGQTITKEEADNILRSDLSKVEGEVEALVKVSLSDNQFAALVSFAFNCGSGALASSSLLKALNAGKYDQVPALLRPWNKANGRYIQGLYDRRVAEGKLFAQVSTPATAPASATIGSKPMTVDLNNITSIANGSKTYILCSVGAAVVLANHFWPGSVPNVQGLDPSAWITQLWDIGLIAAGRSAISKVGP